MKSLFICLLLVISQHAFSQTQYQHWSWAKSFGGTGIDNTTDIKIKNEFLYVTGNFSSPQINWEGTVLTNNGGLDFFVAKLDTSGNTIWVKSFGNIGDDKSFQLEINSNGALVIRCESNSPSLNIGSSTLINPTSFYTMLDVNGNIISAVKLPSGTNSTDIDIDNSNSVYLSVNYERPFVFGSNYIDTIFGSSGAAILKYNNQGQPQWYKALQVSYNRREVQYISDGSNPNTYPNPYDSFIVSSIKKDAVGIIMLEFNEQDTVLCLLAQYNRNAKFVDTILRSSLFFTQSDYPTKFENTSYKITPNGIIKQAFFCPQFGGSFGVGIDDFKTSLNGDTYTAYQQGFISINRNYIIIKERNNVRSAMAASYNTSPNNPPTIPATGWAPYIPVDKGNYLLTAEVPALEGPSKEANRNAVILDSSFRIIKKSQIAEIDNLILNLKCTNDTNAVFFGSGFNDGPLTVNQNIPGYTKVLPNNGQSEIFIGKYYLNGIPMPRIAINISNYRIKNCTPADSFQLQIIVNQNFGAVAPFTYHWNSSIYFSDTTISNPKIFFGTDSFTNRLTITDANGLTFTSKEFTFIKGIPSTLRLVASSNNICENDTLTLSLQGGPFQKCYLTGLDADQIPVNGGLTFDSINQKIKFKAFDSFRPFLFPYNDKEVPQCMIPNNLFIPVKNAFKNIRTVNICRGASYTFADNVTVNNIQNSFTHTIHFTNIEGCDSNYVTNIVVESLLIDTLKRWVCYGTNYRFDINNTILYNVIRDTIITIPYGCYNFRTYILLVMPPITPTVIDTSVCRGSNFLFSNRTFCCANSFTDSITNVQRDTILNVHYRSFRNCDSLIVYKIKVLIASSIVQDTAICYGSNYTFPNGTVLNNIIAPVTYTSRFSGNNSCGDSVIITNVAIKPVYNITIDTTLCEGKNYTFPDGTVQNNITTNRSYTSRLFSVLGCDSIISTNIFVNPIYNFTENKKACYGDTYIFPDQTSQVITSDIQHSSNLLTITNCDSIITTNISLVRFDTSVVKNVLVLKSNENVGAYQWIDCNSGNFIPAANEQTYTATAIGNYAVQLSKEGCKDTSSCYFIYAADLLIRGLPLVDVYPNPVSQTFTIMLQAERPTSIRFSIIDFSGQSVKVGTINVEIGRNVSTQNFSNFAPGIYTLVMQKADTGEMITKKIVKL
jgi:Secretion system C-terminal sorting domain